jgi:para-aminobenzoate synthetase component I
MSISTMVQHEFLFDDLTNIKLKLYGFSKLFRHCNIYDSNNTSPALGIGKYEFLAAMGLKRKLPHDHEQLFEHIADSGNWIFGHFEYQDISNEGYYKSCLYEPEVVFCIQKGSKMLQICNNGLEEGAFEDLINTFHAHDFNIPELTIITTDFTPQTPKEEYMKNVEAIRNDIITGKYYEMNYCIEFRSKVQPVDFLPYFMRLNERTAAPFAAYVKHPDFNILCSSPERFITKRGNELVSQPIKGTNRRLAGEANLAQLHDLQHNEKEKAENVMIVDLVRNDLARVCKPGSVKVKELCGAYAFKTVNHLISTISAELEKGIGLKEMMQALFPMGSMTGAPKLEVMKHIALYEHAERGIYSGCLGYIDPDGDFDFNVLIRSLVFDAKTNEMSYKVGSAITYDSEAEKEYEECLLKGKRLIEAMKI